MNNENIMRGLFLEKITLNVNVGNDKQGMERAKKLLEKLTNRKPAYNIAKKRIATWSIRPGLPIGYKVTLRGKEAEDFLKWILKSKKNVMKKSSVDSFGNFSIGVSEYLDLIGIKYDSEIGVMGFELSGNIVRKGNRIKSRKLRKGKIPLRHRVSKEEAVSFLEKNYEVKFEK